MNMQQPVDGTLMVKNRFVREMLAAQSCLTLHDPMECNLRDSSVPGILQARPRSHSLLQGGLHDPGINLGLPHCRQILYHLSHQGSLYLSEGGGAPLHPQPDL